MKVPVKFQIGYLWKDYAFEKDEWGDINYLIGANGSGKSEFIKRLIPQLKSAGLKTRYLSSDRLAGWIKQENSALVSSQLTSGIHFGWFDEFSQQSRERGEVNEASVLLRNNLNIRIKVESTLSQLLGRNVILEESGGYLIPKISKGKQVAYSFKENESHGIKMLITTLTLLHDDTYNCLIMDEPELHLHPQFQTFFLQEIRKYSGNPLEKTDKKCFFFATHSTHFVDVRTLA